MHEPYEPYKPVSKWKHETTSESYRVNVVGWVWAAAVVAGILGFLRLARALGIGD